MYHGIADFNPCRKLVEHKPANSIFKNCDQVAVKPPALTSGCLTKALPISAPLTNRSEKTPSGNPHSRTLSCTIRPTSSLVPGCAACAFTTTVFPGPAPKPYLLRLRRRPNGSCWHRIRPPALADAAWNGCPAWEWAYGSDWRGQYAPPPMSPLLRPAQTTEAVRRCAQFHLANAVAAAQSPAWRVRSARRRWIRSLPQSCEGTRLASVLEFGTGQRSCLLRGGSRVPLLPCSLVQSLAAAVVRWWDPWHRAAVPHPRLQRKPIIDRPESFAMCITTTFHLVMCSYLPLEAGNAAHRG